MSESKAYIVVLSVAIGLSACTKESRAPSSAETSDTAQPIPSGPQLPECLVTLHNKSDGVVIYCGGPDKPDKPDKPDRPDRPDAPDRSKYIEADRAMTEKAVKAIRESSLPETDKSHHIGVLEAHHEACRGGREKCVGEP